ncbi:MAG TPA: substrate-binding domain-containing protein, partial [Nostocaceae cyanobacterium]|nr:substrate-binding domain-containing protein [Nostocaceae cyanobacterium]
MWQQEKKDSAIASLALWLALAATPLATTMLMSTPATAEPTADTPAFPLPPNVENGTVVKIDGSSSFQSINQGLKNNFEQQFSGTKVELANNGTEAALKALLDGQIDIAAIARELTPAEKAQGLEAISLQPEKIAIVVGANNPFKGSLTTRQFAKIFRGEIQDWSELGAKAGKIRFIDHPATSDTRTALRNAPVFEKGEFTTGANAIQVSDNNPAEIIKQLDKDGISYVLANQISQIVSDVRVIKVEKSGIDNPKYPFSQPLVYVYKQNPSPGVAAFLGFTSAQPGQKAIEAARNQEAKAIAASTLQSFTTVSAATPITATGETTPAATPAPAQAPPVNSGIEQNSTIGNNSALNGVNTPWLMVLPLFLIAVLGGFLPWWLLKRKRSPDENTENPTENNINLPVSTTHPSEDNIEPSIVSSSAATDTISNLHQGATTDEVIPSEAPASGVAVLTAKKTNVVDDISNAETELSTLDGGEVVWDIEAPVAVVNNLYPQIPNRPEMTFDIELSTDEFIGPASELTDELVEESISELNNPLLKLPDIADTSNSDINSLSELLEASAQTNADLLDNTAKTPTEASLSLSELLDASAKASTEDSLSLSNLLEETTETPTEASQSLSELLDASAKASTEDSLSLSDLLDNTAKTSTEASLSLSQLLDATAKASTEDSLTEISDLPETSAPTSSEESTISEFLDNASDFVDHYIAADEVPTSLPDTAAQTSNEESTISDVLDQNSDFLDDYITSDDVLAFQPYTIIESSDDALAELPEELGQALDALMDDSAATLSDNATITDDFALPDEIEDSLPDLPEELGQVLDALVDNSTVALSDLPDTSDESENLTFDLDESLNVKDSSTEAEELTFDVEDALTEAEDLTFDVEDSSTEAGDLTFGVEDALTEAEDLTFNVEDSSTEANDANLELEDAFAQANDSTLELEDAFA